MPKELYVAKRFNKATAQLITMAQDIVAEYSRQGFSLTVRQLYYQFVARGHIANNVQEYKRLARVVNDARLAGLLDWNAIEDRLRNVVGHASWVDPASIIDSAAYSFRMNPWKLQPYHIEVWIEKDALSGVIEPVCRRWRVPSFACRGYTSQSEAWRAGKRFAEKKAAGKHVLVLHLGDHDPSGMDMTRDNWERLDMFTRGTGVFVERLALNMDQVQELNPPENPAKMSDARAAGYVEEFGHSSWELDALDPPYIDNLIDTAIRERMDQPAWDAVLAEEEQHRKLLTKTAKNWTDVATYVEGL
jgi:hypothetical protein